MNYHDFITIHLFSVMIFIANLLLYIAIPDSRKYQIMSVLSFLIAGTTGVILALRFGLTSDVPMPSWIIIKYASWGTMGIFTLIVSKKFKPLLNKLYWPWLAVVFLSVIVSIYKPL